MADSPKEEESNNIQLNGFVNKIVVDQNNSIATL